MSTFSPSWSGRMEIDPIQPGYLENLFHFPNSRFKLLKFRSLDFQTQFPPNKFQKSSKFKYYLIKILVTLCLFTNLNVCLIVIIKFKSRFRRMNWTFWTIWCRTVSILVRTKASLTEPFDHIAPICMIVSGKAWLGWLLHCPLITILLPWCHIVIHICLVMSMHLLSIILDMLNAWVIGLW
jgi:hypothetical protein